MAAHLEWIDDLGPSKQWLQGVVAGKVTDFAGETEAADAPLLRDYAPVKRVAMPACLVHKTRMRTRDELKAIREQQQAIVEALVGNYRMLLKNVDSGGPAQSARARAAELTEEALGALEGLDEEATAKDVAERLGEGQLSPALLTLMKALAVQAGGLGAPIAAVERFGGFEGQYEQIEKVSVHHGNNWEILLYGQLRKDRSLMFDLTGPGRLELTSTSEDWRVLKALEHAKKGSQ